MRDPERLLSGVSDVDPLERELLASLRDEQAPSSVRRGAWQGIAAALVAAAPASAAAAVSAASGAASAGAATALTTPGGASAAAGTSAAISGMAGGSIAPAAAAAKLAAGLGGKAAAVLITKWALVGALSAGAVGGAIWAVDRQSAAPSANSVAAPQAAAPRHQVGASAASAPSSTQQSAAAPASSAPVDPPPSASDHKSIKPARVNALAAESALLQNARAELRAGDLTAASDSLKLLQRRFPRGVLNQEREVLRIELASARGDSAGARRLAARFLRAYPESPHAAQLRQLAAAQ